MNSYKLGMSCVSLIQEVMERSDRRLTVIGRILFALSALLFVVSFVSANVCVKCHEGVNPGIVSDWKLSKHGQNEIYCSTCHGEDHTSEKDVANVRIPTPETCAACHEAQVEQFSAGKHAFAWAAMKAMPTAHWQPIAMMEGMKGCGGCHKIGLKTEEEIEQLKAERHPAGDSSGSHLPDLSHAKW